MARNRTYHFRGVKDVYASLVCQHSNTHSYTVQHHISKGGEMGSLFLIIFQETHGKFGPFVGETIDAYMSMFKNVVYCSSSGKMGISHVREWFGEVFCPQVTVDSETEKFVLLLDSFSGQGNNAALTSLTDIDVCIEYIPKGTTYLCQPCDLALFRQLKALIRPMVRICRERFLCGQSKLKPNNRLFIVACQFLAHNQLRAERFVPMLKHAWQTGGYTHVDKVELFRTVTEVNFSKLLSELSEEPECKNAPFIRCAHCSQVLCYSHFVLDFHYHAVNSEPMPDLTLVQQQLVSSSDIDDNEINQN